MYKIRYLPAMRLLTTIVDHSITQEPSLSFQYNTKKNMAPSKDSNPPSLNKAIKERIDQSTTEPMPGLTD